MSTMGRCTKCGNANEYSKVICDFCGARLPWADGVKESVKQPLKAAPVANIAKQAPSPQNVKGCQKTMGCGCLSIIALFAFALFATRGIDDKTAMVAPDPYVSSTTSVPSNPVSAPIYDIPSLIGLDLNGVQRVLGSSPPKGLTEEIKHNMIYSQHYDWDCEWDKGGFTLDVNYDTRTNQVIDFFLTEDTGSGLTNGTSRLISAGNLANTSSHYKLEFVAATGHPDEYTGVVVKPN